MRNIEMFEWEKTTEVEERHSLSVTKSKVGVRTVAVLMSVNAASSQQQHK